MNNRTRMMQKAKEQAEKKNRWWEKLMEIVRANRIDRKPHEKVIDTTWDRAPEFYDGFKSLVTEDSEAECKEGLEHLHHQEYMEAHICFLKAARAGYAEGQYRLGSLYMYGRGMGADYNLAEIWFHEAEKNGFTSQVADAMKILERFRNGGWKYE